MSFQITLIIDYKYTYNLCLNAGCIHDRIVRAGDLSLIIIRHNIDRAIPCAIKTQIKRTLIIVNFLLASVRCFRLHNLFL